MARTQRAVARTYASVITAEYIQFPCRLKMVGEQGNKKRSCGNRRYQTLLLTLSDFIYSEMS